MPAAPTTGRPRPPGRHIFEDAYAELPRQLPLKFALPGAERQDSVYSGLRAIDPRAALIAIHDSARPLVTAQDAARCFRDAWKVGVRGGAAV